MGGEVAARPPDSAERWIVRVTVATSYPLTEPELVRMDEVAERRFDGRSRIAAVTRAGAGR